MSMSKCVYVCVCVCVCEERKDPEQNEVVFVGCVKVCFK